MQLREIRIRVASHLSPQSDVDRRKLVGMPTGPERRRQLRTDPISFLEPERKTKLNRLIIIIFFIHTERGALGEQRINSSRNMGVRRCVCNSRLSPKLKRRLSFLSLFGERHKRLHATSSLDSRPRWYRVSLRFKFPVLYVLSPLRSTPNRNKFNSQLTDNKFVELIKRN